MTFSRLIIPKSKILLINLLFLTFGISFNSFGIQNYVIQIAASKSPLNIQQFARDKAITDSISEIKGMDWYRYYIGHFESYKEAFLYSKELTSKTNLNKVYIRNLFDIPGYKQQEKNKTIARPANVAVESKDINHAEQADSQNIHQNVNNSETIPEKQPDKITQQQKKKFSENNINTYYDHFEKDLRKTIPSFIKKIFNSYSKKKYGYRVILLFFLILFLFILNIIIVILIFIYSNREQNYTEQYLAVYKNRYETTLLSYLLGETDWEDTQNNLKKTNVPQNRELLSSILLNLHENLKGGAEQMIPEIFIKLGLHHDALQQANSKIYYEKVAGIRKLTFLYPDGAMKIIPELLNDPDNIVRAEAQTAYVRLYPDEPFQFLKTQTKSFTRWTQITSFYIFRLHSINIPSFADYLNSQNTNVRNFSLRMIIFFQQLENIPEVLKMINSNVESTRFLTIKAINDLRLYDGKSLLKDKFWDETSRNRIEIVKAFKNIGDKTDFDFLEKIILLDNVSLKLEICRSMYYMGKEGKERLFSLNEEMNGELDLYIAHISDSRN